MDTVIFSKARAELAGLLDKVNEDVAPIEIIRRDKPSAVLISKDEYEGMVETLHLLSTPANATRWHAAKVDVESDRYVLKVIPRLKD